MVNPETLENFGAVSKETAQEMVLNARKVLNADYALATTGIMGPGGGSEEKPVGTVWVAVADDSRVKTLQLHLRFDRRRNIEQTALTALNFLRKFIIYAET